MVEPQILRWQVRMLFALYRLVYKVLCALGEWNGSLSSLMSPSGWVCHDLAAREEILAASSSKQPLHGQMHASPGLHG